MKGRKDLVASAAYLPEPAAVAAARKFVRDTLRSWLDTAVLLGHCRPIGTSGSVYPWFWSVM